MKKRSAKKHGRHWSESDPLWRRHVLDTIERVVEGAGFPFDDRTRAVVLRRMGKLMTFVHFYFPEAPGDPFDVYDAAALVLWPRWRAFRLAKSLFGAGRGIAADLQAEDLTYNMDWLNFDLPV